MKRQGGGVRETFTVRKTSNGVGVEKTWPVHSPPVSYTHLIFIRAVLYVLEKSKAFSAALFAHGTSLLGCFPFCFFFFGRDFQFWDWAGAVSYTHLDVYKRQVSGTLGENVKKERRGNGKYVTSRTFII